MTLRCCVQWASLKEHNLNGTSEMRKQKVGKKKRKHRSQCDESPLGSQLRRKYEFIECHIFRSVIGVLSVSLAGPKDWPHRSRNSQETLTVPEVHLDYCFIREAAGKDYSVVLVGKDRETKLILAHVVPFKGGDTEWVSEQVCRDLQKFGIRGDVVFKTDQEPALVDLVKQICALRPSSRSCLTHSGVGGLERKRAS